MNDNWFEDSVACLNVAKDTILYLEKTVPNAVEDEVLIPYVKVYTKNTLENLRSPLDYSANFIFNEYCREMYVSNNEIRKNGAVLPKFPLTDNKDKFEKEMDRKFKGLDQTQPEVYRLLESMQYFNNKKWVKILNKLVNDNKHNFLTKHALKEFGIQVKYLKTIDGSILNNVGAFNSGKDNIVLGDIPFNEITAPTHPFVEEYDADFFYKLHFLDTNTEVVDTLTNIYKEIREYIFNLQEITKKNP